MNKNDLRNNLGNGHAVNHASFASAGDSDEQGARKAYEGSNGGSIKSVVITSSSSSSSVDPTAWDEDQNQFIGSLFSMFFGTALFELR